MGTRKVPLNTTELYGWTARETRWKRYMVSRESPVTLVNLRPSSDRNAVPVVFIGPRVSKDRGWKMWEDGRDEYFADFLYYCVLVPVAVA